MISNPKNIDFLIGILNCWSEMLLGKSSNVCIIFVNFNSKCGSTYLKGLVFLLSSLLSLCFLLGANILSHKNCTPWLGRPKFAHLWVCLRIMGLILSDLTGVGILILYLLNYFPFLSLWDLISSLLLSVSLSLLFQTCIIHKEAHHPSSIEILMVGIQVFLV